MRVKPRFLLGGGLIVAALAYLIATAIRNSAEYYLTVSEAQARQAELHGQALRVAGRVTPGSVVWDPSSLTLKFTIGSIPGADPAPLKPVSAVNTAQFRVVCRGQPKPDMFAENRDVIVEGRLDAGNSLIASQVLTSCPSKYVPKKPS